MESLAAVTVSAGLVDGDGAWDVGERVVGVDGSAHDEEYGEPETGLELVAVVVQVGFVVSDKAVSPLTKPA